MQLFHVIILCHFTWAVPFLLKLELSMFGLEIPSTYFTLTSVTVSLICLAYFYLEYKQELEKKDD